MGGCAVAAAVVLYADDAADSAVMVAADADGAVAVAVAAALLLPHMGDNERDCDVNNCVVADTSPEERERRPRGCRWCLLQTLVVINHG
jgi:hypothetical protein